MANVFRYYGLDYAEDASNDIENDVVTTGKDVEVTINLGNSGGTTAEQAASTFMTHNRAIVLSQLQRIVSELESGKLPWPPATS